MSRDRAASGAARLYSLLLRSLLPESLRRSYGPQMAETFLRLRRDARASAGVRGELAVWWRELSQLYAVGRFERRQRVEHTESGAVTAGRATSASAGDGGRRPGHFSRLTHNVVCALKGLRRTPAFAATVIATLALGIGANATMFGVIDRVLLRPPEHVVDADDVVRLYVQRRFINRTITSSSITYPDYLDLAAAERLAATAAFSSNRAITVGHGAEASRVQGAFVTPSFFSLLGAKPFMGRFLSPEDDVEGAATVAVLGHEEWRRRGGDAAVLGSQIRLGGAPHSVVGVAPPGFTGVGLERTDVWLPLRSPANSNPASLWEGSRGYYWLQPIARLAANTSVEAAAAEATALHRAGRAGDEYYDQEASVITAPLTVARGPDQSRESLVARWLSGVSLVVLLVACANVANMLLARAVRRQRETGVRLALGVSRGQLIAQHLTESVLLALAGGVAALLVAYWGAHAIRAVLLPTIHWPETPLNPRVLLFTFVASLASGVVAGVIPALQAARRDVLEVLRGEGLGGGRAGSHARVGLMVGQAALSVVLLVGAGLFVKSMAHVRALDLGFEPEGLLVAIPEFDESRLPGDQLARYFDEVLPGLRAMPAIDGASVTAALPFYWALSTAFEVPGREELPSFSDGGPYIYAVGPEFLATTGIAVRRGRDFTPSDDASAPRVAVIGENMASAYWPDEDPLGTCVHINRDEGCTRIIGIAEAANRGSLTGSGSAQYYVPAAQWSEAFVPRFVVVRAGRDHLDEVIPVVQRQLQAGSDAVRFVDVRAFQGLIDPGARSWQLGATLFSAFGALALVIASVGLYGALSFSVAQRTREIGVRSALGASRRGVIALVAWQASRWLLAGLLVGVVVALAAGSWVQPLLFDVDARDPAVLAGVALLLLAVGMVASAVPALRAARVPPVIALRRG